MMQLQPLVSSKWAVTNYLNYNDQLMCWTAEYTQAVIYDGLAIIEIVYV